MTELSSALKKEPALIIGAIAAAAIALIGGLEDGFTFNPDGWEAIAAFLGALGIRSLVFSPASAEKLAIIPPETPVARVPGAVPRTPGKSADAPSRGIR